jgi:hypothetical protein
MICAMKSYYAPHFIPRRRCGHDRASSTIGHPFHWEAWSFRIFWRGHDIPVRARCVIYQVIRLRPFCDLFDLFIFLFFFWLFLFVLPSVAPLNKWSSNWEVEQIGRQRALRRAFLQLRQCTRITLAEHETEAHFAARGAVSSSVVTLAPGELLLPSEPPYVSQFSRRRRKISTDMTEINGESILAPETDLVTWVWLAWRTFRFVLFWPGSTDA